MYKVFVYGTLKKGFTNHDRIFAGYDIKITPAWTYGELYDLGYFPAMTEGNFKVRGELVEFDDLVIMQKIDKLEGYKGKDDPFNFYDRANVTIFIHSKTPKIAWVYLLSGEKIKDMVYKPVRIEVW